MVKDTKKELHVEQKNRNKSFLYSNYYVPGKEQLLLITYINIYKTYTYIIIELYALNLNYLRM